ncbi:2188_t:CDS:1, partial [Ambispora gerdemannii]
KLAPPNGSYEAICGTQVRRTPNDFHGPRNAAKNLSLPWFWKGY